MQEIHDGEATLLLNSKTACGQIETALQGISEDADCKAAFSEISSWEEYRETPLIRLEKYETKLGLKAVYFKDESARLGLNGIKALEASYAVFRLLLNKIREIAGEKATRKDLTERKYDDIVSKITVLCVAGGNHASCVAWAARMFGAKCTVYAPAGTSGAERETLERYGAVVKECDGGSEDAARACTADSEQNGMIFLSEAACPDYAQAPSDMMSGYAVAVDEALRQIPERPTHIFVQCGNGRLAATVAARFCRDCDEAEAPLVVTVEPNGSAAVYSAVKNGENVSVSGKPETVMGDLCQTEAFEKALSALRKCAAAFMTIPDTLIPAVMCDLANKECAQTPVVSGHSGVCGLAGLITACDSSDFRKALNLGENSVVLLFGSEGAADSGVYEKIVGKTVQEVLNDPEKTP